MVELHLGVNYNGQAQNLIYLPGTIINFYGTYIPGKTINIYLDGVVRTHITAVQVDNTGYFSINAPLPTVSVGQTYAIRACTAGSLGIYECALFPDQSVETINLTVSGTGTGTCSRGLSYTTPAITALGIGGCESGYIEGLYPTPLGKACYCDSPEGRALRGEQTVVAEKERATDWTTIAIIAGAAIIAAVLLPKLVGGKR